MSIASRVVVRKREANRRQAWDGASWPVRAAIVRHLEWPISRTWWTYDHMNDEMRQQIARAALELQEACAAVSEVGAIRQ
jgi:hypothetical protein